MRSVLALVICLTLISCSSTPPSQSPEPKPTVAVPGQVKVATIAVPISGAELFAAYCASCHGTDGKGNGPASGALNSKLPDLTTLARRRGRKFPEGDVYQVVKWGGGIVGHGSKEMPVWGTAFKSDTNPDEKAADERIRTLTSYIGSIQTK